MTMNEDAKKTALRMIPYGIYVLTAESGSGTSAATVNWVTQTSFALPQVVVGVKADSGAHAIIKETGTFALNILGKDHGGMAFTFFKSLEREGDSIGGEPLENSPAGVPLLTNAPAWVECKLVNTIEGADHSIFIGEVTEAGVRQEPDGRADDAILWMKDLGERVFYGG